MKNKRFSKAKKDKKRDKKNIFSNIIGKMMKKMYLCTSKMHNAECRMQNAKLTIQH